MNLFGNKSKDYWRSWDAPFCEPMLPRDIYKEGFAQLLCAQTFFFIRCAGPATSQIQKLIVNNAIAYGLFSNFLDPHQSISAMMRT